MLTPNDLTDLDVLTARILAFQDRYNATATPFPPASPAPTSTGSSSASPPTSPYPNWHRPPPDRCHHVLPARTTKANAEVKQTVTGESHAWVEAWTGGWWGYHPRT